MAKRERWYFTKEELEDSPSRRCGISADKELYYRQQAANIIQELGQKLKVQQLVINTAIVYMHRFYTLHSFSHFHRHPVAACALFLAAKVEEQHRKLEHVIRVSQICQGKLMSAQSEFDTKSEQYQQLAAELVHLENLMLRTLGFDLRVHHPHTWIVNYFDLIRGKKDLAQIAYIMATNILHLTTMCLQYKPATVACICIYFVFKWANFELPKSSEGKNWWCYIDETVTQSMLDKTTGDLLTIFKNSPSRLRRLLNSSGESSSSKSNHVRPSKSKDQKEHEKDPALLLAWSSPANKYGDPRQHRRDNISLPKEKYESTCERKMNSFQNQSLIKELNSLARTTLRTTTNNSATTRSNSSSIADDKFIKLMEYNNNNNTNNNNNNSNNSMPNSNDKMNKSNLSVINSNNNNRLSCNINNLTDSLLYPYTQNDSDYLDTKKGVSDFKMEFSDNEDSNISDYNIGLSSTFILNDNSNSGVNNHQNPMSSNSFADFSQQLNQNNNNKIYNKLTNQYSPSPALPSPFFNEFPSNSNHSTDLYNIPCSPPQGSSEKPNIQSLKLKPTFFGNKHQDLNIKPEQPNVQASNTQNSSFNYYSDSQIPFSLLGSESTSTKLLAPTNSLASSSSSSSLNPLLPPHSILPSQVIPRNNLNSTPNTSSSILGGVHHQDQSAAAAAAFNQLVNDTSTTNMMMINNILNNSLDETSNHSRTSSHQHKHHKEKHKHKDKHKHKHKEKHKHKHKSKDKDKHNRHKQQEAELSSQSQPSFSLVTPEDQSKNQQRIKLKIIKKNLVTSNNEINDSNDSKSSPQQIESSQTEAPLKFKINLKRQNISTTPPSTSSSSSLSQPKKKSRKN